MLRWVCASAGLLLCVAGSIVAAHAEDVVVLKPSLDSSSGGQLIRVAAVTGYNVNIVEYNGGQFRFLGDKKWVEINNNGRNYYAETNRTDTDVVLFDKGRNVNIVLSTTIGGFINYSIGSDAPGPLYTVTGVHN